MAIKVIDKLRFPTKQEEQLKNEVSILQVSATCRLVQPAGQCVLQVSASCRQYILRCVLQVSASCRSVRPAGQCVLQVRASCRPLHPAVEHSKSVGLQKLTQRERQELGCRGRGDVTSLRGRRNVTT